jgi:hypothetical protein
MWLILSALVTFSTRWNIESYIPRLEPNHQHGSLHNTALTAETVLADHSRPRDALYPDLHDKPIDDGVLHRWQDAIVLGYCLGAKAPWTPESS